MRLKVPVVKSLQLMTNYHTVDVLVGKVVKRKKKIEGGKKR